MYLPALQRTGFPALFFLLCPSWGLALRQGEERLQKDLVENTAPGTTHLEESTGTLEKLMAMSTVLLRSLPSHSHGGLFLCFFNPWTKS